ncbi:MAG: low molecular weight phosphotyrosine protein phosphatase [Halomonas sp.]|uniref:low molecular weight protein-tyrosine-phosphatase n=1 Tax=Halomonas sp. TaxID=1486246 RepID=UPI0019E7ACD8|nr:low molecular weight protein-tyrosine-phosphatase [Halomonas sp.]MBE0490322.1 low molecular weight phosphotyrosine protein phosphatase [Halomonas sp.]
MFQHILVVCTGNICRSPVAEAMLRRSMPDKQLSSAGLGALVGHGVEPTARALVEAEGLDVSGHQARQLTVDMLHSADLILVMSNGQRRAIADLAPEALGKTMTLGKWLEAGKGKEIPDPYRKSREVFEHVHMLLKQATDAWANRL